MVAPLSASLSRHTGSNPHSAVTKVFFSFFSFPHCTPGPVVRLTSVHAGLQCRFSPRYRDPNSVDTLRAFDESIAWAAAGNITAKDIEEAKLGLFQGVDAPVSPAGRGTREFMSGVTDEMQQQRRERLLDVTEHDVARVAEQYLVNAERQATAIIGPEGGAHNFAELEGWTVKSVDT